ncbi:hypothetical protein C8J56DRAFT_900201 [Mycena floridula]|nr:hypothetical protein C8J56DRAFT_408275 [Mycena floridula]KAJ7576291.1 hypothetical protein C8J56DRAFT_900201 [Mycena floridula]
MHFTKVFVALFTVSAVAAHPMFLQARAPVSKPPAKAPAPPAKNGGKPKPAVVTIGPEGRPTDRMRKENMKPGRILPQKCKMPNDCTNCPNLKNGAPGTVVSCDIKRGGWCNCDDKAIAAIANPIMGVVMKGLAEMGNAPVFKAVTNLVKGFEDIKQVAQVILSAVLPPGAKQAVKAFFEVWPKFTPSHIDDATKGVLDKIMSKVA